MRENLSSNEYDWENGRLRSIQWDYNKLSGDMDLSVLDALEELYVEDNELTSLDVSKCTALEELYCYGNRMSVLDVTNNTLLKELECGNQKKCYRICKHKKTQGTFHSLERGKDN